jgi:hypothetical protein
MGGFESIFENVLMRNGRMAGWGIWRRYLPPAFGTNKPNFA